MGTRGQKLQGPLHAWRARRDQGGLLSRQAEALGMLAALGAAVGRVEAKVDALIEALAAEEEDEQPMRSLDDGRAFPSRDDRKGLG